jgi:hypothetical protein
MITNSISIQRLFEFFIKLLKSFTGLQGAGFNHVPRSQPMAIELRKGAKSLVPLADRVIGNLQQWLIGTHHGLSRDQLQVYLEEFVFRHNRMRLPMAAFSTCSVSAPGANQRVTSRYAVPRTFPSLDRNKLWHAETTG